MRIKQVAYVVPGDVLSILHTLFNFLLTMTPGSSHLIVPTLQIGNLGTEVTVAA